MVRCGSIFSQMLSLVDRREFGYAVARRKAERYAKGYGCWEQFVAMTFCQLAQAHSLREICGGLSCCTGKVVHLGMGEAPRRTTLAYANEHRPWELYQDVFGQLLARCRGLTKGKRKFRFKNKLYSLDATVIDLCLRMFPWAKFLQTKGAVKLHLLLDHEGYLPDFAHLTEGNVHEVRIARMLSFAPGSIIVMDKGYVDYRLFGRWTEEGVFFVTRQKKNADYRVVKRTPPAKEKGVLADQVIRLRGPGAAEKCPHFLRRVVVWDEKNRKRLVLLTNQMEFSAATIAAIYKERWQIEIFFKALKQNLKVKTFVGTSPNALKTQIWTALIAILMLKYLQFKSTLSWALSNLVAFLRWNLFTYRDLWAWINDPFETPPVEPEPDQTAFSFAVIGQHNAVNEARG